MKFSVVVPVHNNENTLERTLTSILSQSFDDFEVIVIDDASTDRTSDVIAGVEDPRLRCARRDVPGPGGYAARNLGVGLARGEFVTFLDADDVWDEHHLATMRDVCDRHSSVAFFGSGWRSIVGDIVTQNAFSRRMDGPDGYVDLEKYFQLIRKRWPPVWTGVACLRVSALSSTDVFPTNSDIRRGGDAFAWLRLMCEHQALIVSNHVGATYMRDDSTVTRSADLNHELYSADAYDELAALVPMRLHSELRRHFNRALAFQWIHGAIEDRPTFRIWKRIWKRDLDVLVATVTAASLLPRGLVRAILRRALTFRRREN